MGAWWVCVVLVAAAGGGRGDPSWLNEFGSGLHSKLSDALQEVDVQYYEPVLNGSYVSTVQFDMRAMGPLYNSTKLLIDFIANKQAYPEGIVSVSDGHVEVAPAEEHWRELLAHYAGPTTILVIALLLVAALPLAGLFWCCCYWCRVGRRRRPFDRKYDACLKGLLAIILIGLLTLFLFGVVCAFATDEQLERSTREAPGSLRAGVRDVQTFLNETQAHARWLLVVNFRQVEDKVNEILNTSGSQVSQQLGEFSRAVSVTTLNRMVQQLNVVQRDLRSVQNVTASLRYNAERLNTGLRKVRHQLLLTLQKCEQPQCRRLQDKYRIGQLDTQIQYNQMPDVSELLNNVTALLESDIQAEVAEGQRVFLDIQRGIQRGVGEHIPQVRGAVSDAGRRLRALADEITHRANNASRDLGDGGAAAADSLQTARDNYGPYRRYVGLGAATALLLITSLLAWGLLCGVCGKRPDVYGANDCCNKGAGSKCLLCGMGLMFVVGGAVALVLAVYFAVGVASQRFLCDPLTEQRDNRLFSDVEQFVELEKLMFNERRDPAFNLTAVLAACHRNRTVYETFHLSRLYDLEALQQELESELHRQLDSLRPATPAGATRVVILKPSAKRKLNQLADTGLSEFNFDRILQALETNITSLSLDSLAAQLEATAAELMTRPAFTRVTIDLRDAAAMLRAYHDDIVVPMTQHTHLLNQTAIELRDSLRFNHSSLKEAVSHLMAETSQAEGFLSTQGPDLIQNLTREFGARIASPLSGYLERLVTHAHEHVGRCGPLSHAYNATRDAACKKILMPINGYWISLSWCVLLFVPLMVVAQRLARLYLHLDPYPGPLVEAEYLYDAYADRDNVPLAKGSKRSTLDIEGKIAEWKCRATAPPASPGGGGGEARGSTTALLLEGGGEVVCALVPPPPPAALLDDLKTRLDVKDEDNESGIHESDAYKAEKRSREGRGGGGGGGGGVSRPRSGDAGAGPAPQAAPPLDAHHARRYNDMAPKHWEEGPPRYLGHGPTEYERPPPYYYPGPADRQ